jgi:hypothetical protein
MSIQSILLDKSKFSRSNAIRWVKKHNMRPNTSAPNFATTHFYRFRQMPPKKTYRYRAKKISDGVELVLAYNKKSRTTRTTRKKHKQVIQ